MKRFAAALLLPILFAAPAQAQARRPNVVVFLVDDMGWTDCGAYGSQYYETPNIDRLAARGLLFRNAYSANPLCSPTRASILTGKYPARLGITSAAGHLPHLPENSPRYPDGADSPQRRVISPESLRYLPLSEVTLAQALHDAGYRTGHFGKWHLGADERYWPTKRGYDVAWHGTPDPGPGGPNGYFSPYGFRAGSITSGPDGEYIVDRVTDEAIRFIEENRDRPFLASVWQFGVHGPWGHKEEYTKQFLDKKDPTGKHGNPVMASMLKSVDESLGRIVGKLEELGLADDTIILFTSDNGGNVHSNTEEDASRKQNPNSPRNKSLESYHQFAGFQPPTNNAPLRAGKGTLYEGGVRIPLIVAWPGHVPAGKTSDAVVSTIDYFPTLIDLLDVPNEKNVKFDGVSLKPVLRDPAAKLPREALFNFFPHGGPAKPPGVTVRQGQWKLIRWFETGPKAPAEFELYDLEADIGETKNLADQQPERVKELSALIDGFLADTKALVPIPNPHYEQTAKAPREAREKRRAARAKSGAVKENDD